MAAAAATAAADDVDDVHHADGPSWSIMTMTTSKKHRLRRLDLWRMTMSLFLSLCDGKLLELVVLLALSRVVTKQ